MIFSFFLLVAGCVSPAGSFPGGAVTTPPTSEPTPLATTSHPVPAYVPASDIQQEYVTVATLPVTPIQAYYPLVTVTLPADYTRNVSYRHYSNPVFAIEYPSTWTIEQGTTTRFTSPDKKVVFSATVQDFIAGYAGNFRLNTDYSWVLNRVSSEYPRFDPHNLVYDYSVTTRNSIPMATYFVKLPDGSRSYARYVLVSVRHGYEFTFSADSADFENTTRIRNDMIDSLVIEDTI